VDKRACGSWRLALLAVGHIPDADPGVTRRKWTVQRIIEAIQQRSQEGKPLNHAAVSKDGHGLTTAARKYLGSWSNALAAAGVELQKCRRGRRAKPRP
jgi:hypothetical protein